jgi:hypothetical protein
MLLSVAAKVRKLARQLCADVYPNTDQFVYTNPGSDWPSDSKDEVWPGGFENNKENEPASKKDDEKKKWDTVRLGPGPTQTDWVEKGERPSFRVDIDAPKTDEQDKCKSTTKPKGEEDGDINGELDRETWQGEGVNDSFSF